MKVLVIDSNDRELPPVSRTTASRLIEKGLAILISTGVYKIQLLIKTNRLDYASEFKMLNNRQAKAKRNEKAKQPVSRGMVIRPTQWSIDSAHWAFSS